MKKTFPAIKTRSNNHISYIAFLPVLELKEIINKSKTINYHNGFEMKIAIKVNQEAKAEWIECDIQHDGIEYQGSGLLVINNIEFLKVSLPNTILKSIQKISEESLVDETIPVLFEKEI